MAVFNPQLPPNDPNFLGFVGRPVEEPKANQSGKIALETIGEGISGAVALTDQTIKRVIDNDVYTSVDKERDQFTSALETIKGQLDNNTIPPAVKTAEGSSTGKSLLDANAQMTDEEIPEGVSSGVDRINRLSDAKRAGSIKLNDTQYSAAVLSKAKELRAQYPTYREYIDQKISQASGLPVANSYYQNLMLDINRQLNQMQTKKDDIGTIMKSNLDVPGMAGFMVQRANNDPKYIGDAAVLDKVNKWQTLMSQTKIDAAMRAASKDDFETQERTQKKNLTRSLNGLISTHIENNIALSGMPTLRDLINYFDDVSAGRVKSDDATVQQRGEQLLTYQNYIYRQAKSIAAGPEEVIGNKTSEEIIANAMVPITTYVQLMKDKLIGPANFHLRQNQASVEDEKYNNFLFDKDRAAISRRLMGVRGVMGEQYFPDYIKSIMTHGADKPIADLFSQEALSAVMPVQDARGQPIPRYLIDAVKHAKTKEGIPFEYYGSLVEWTNKITDPMMPLTAKDKLVDWAFNSKNIGLLDEFKMDYRDPNTGQWVPGKYRAYNIMTSPSMSMNIAESSKLRPENYVKYQNWAESEYGKLYREDLKTLNKVMEKPYLGVHFGYDSDAKQFLLVDSKNRVIQRNERALGVENPNAVYINGALDVLDRVNSGLGRLALVHKSNPGGAKDVDEYLLKTLQTAGFRPGSNLTNATEGMSKALIKSRNPELTPDQLNERFLKLSKPVQVQGLE